MLGGIYWDWAGRDGLVCDNKDKQFVKVLPGFEIQRP